MSDFVATRRFHALRFSLDRGNNLSCSGRCLRSAASNRACGCAHGVTACAAMFGGHALDVVEGLTVRRVHVEMLESFRSAVISEDASFLASLQATKEGGLGERLPANTTGF